MVSTASTLLPPHLLALYCGFDLAINAFASLADRTGALQQGGFGMEWKGFRRWCGKAAHTSWLKQREQLRCGKLVLLWPWRSQMCETLGVETLQAF